jgi:Ca2+-binding EF-hand superfamily protein
MSSAAAASSTPAAAASSPANVAAASSSSATAAAASSPAAAAAATANGSAPAVAGAPAAAATGAAATPGSPAGLKSPGKSRPTGKSGLLTGAPVFEDEKQPIVWKGAARAKKLFKVFDHDKDKVLNRAEFEAGLKGFVNGPDLEITPEQIEALWLETDVNKDEKVSWAEFQYRFCGGPNPLTTGKKAEKKLSLHLQTPRKKEVLTGKNAGAIALLKSVLEAIYDGPKPRYKEVDLTKTKQMNPAALKKLLSQVLAEEKAEAKAKKRPVEEWAAPLVSTGIDTKTCDKLFVHMDHSKTGVLNLTQFFDQMKLRPGKNKSKKKKKANVHAHGPQAYTLTTVKPEHVRDWVSELLLKNMPDNVAHSVKCHPPLKHWGDDERKRKSLNTEGYKTTIFLSERTKVKAVVKLAPPEPMSPLAGGEEKTPAVAASASKGRPGSTEKKAAASSSSAANRGRSASPSKSPASSARGPAPKAAAAAVEAAPVNHSDILVFAAYRTEYTAMARSEFLWHARLTLDEDENLKQVEIALRTSWVDGEVDKNSNEAAFENWIQFVGHEDVYEEMSIPPIA